MLITFAEHDVHTPSGEMRVHVISPKIAQYPKARFPGVVVFSEIYQTTEPVLRFAQSIAAEGYVVAAPCIFHEFEGANPIPYDTEGTDRGNEYKYKKQLKAYDDDAKATVDLLVSLPNCNGRIAATGMCLGGHHAFRAAFDPRVLATVCYFPTDIHDERLGAPGEPGTSDSLKRAEEIKGEVVLIFGVNDTHVGLEGRTKIRERVSTLGIPYSILELQAAHAFIRDTSSKGRFDGALSRVCFSLLLEVFGRTVGIDTGDKVGEKEKVEHVC